MGDAGHGKGDIAKLNSQEGEERNRRSFEEEHNFVALQFSF